jgi:hypothetical protein
MRKLPIWLGTAAVAGITATWIWALAIDGEWEAQSQSVADIAYALLVLTTGLALAALVAAFWSRSWRLMIGMLFLAAFAVVYGAASVLAIAFSRSPGGFGLM